MKDAYKILGLKRSASADEIKGAYRKLAREHHPDLDRDNPWAEDAFKEITAAYQVLSHPDKRQQYDRGEIDAFGSRQANKKAPGGMARGWRKKRADAPKSAIRVDGANVSYSLSITAREAARGAVKHVSMTNGKRLRVSIPPATRNGQTLRLKGQGMPGFGGGKDGDALVDIKVSDAAEDMPGAASAPPKNAANGANGDVRVEVAVTLKEAVLGGKIDVPTQDGTVSVTIPEGSNTGTVLRLKGKGRMAASDERGDQYVTLKIVLPQKPDPALIGFCRSWRGGEDYPVKRRVDETI